MKKATEMPEQGANVVFSEGDRVTGRSKIGSWFSGDKMFIAMHFIPLAAIWTGVTWKAVWLGVALYWIRMSFVTAGYHRYFAHKSFETSRIFQFILAFGAETTGQKGVLWWSGHHRDHHKYSDTEKDVHSLKVHGFYTSHIGWIFDKNNKRVPLENIQDFAKYPEIRFISKHDWIAPWALGVASFLIAGWPGLWIGFFLSTLITYHSTFTINSLTHKWGKQRYATGEESRNHWLLALTTMGEGWHNNHHYYQASARMGFYWWEIDLTYYVLRFLSFFGIVWNLKGVPKAVRDKTMKAQAARTEKAAQPAITPVANSLEATG
ncbi:MAG TPA: acyl-CoA desaturase [Turneriella sp.]|nr:acyl-CoA desaturase [Turneriella sp.]